MMRAWQWLRDADNRGALTAVGGCIVVLVGWASGAFTFFQNRPTVSSNTPSSTVVPTEASGQPTSDSNSSNSKSVASVNAPPVERSGLPPGTAQTGSSKKAQPQPIESQERSPPAPTGVANTTHLAFAGRGSATDVIEVIISGALEVADRNKIQISLGATEHNDADFAPNLKLYVDRVAVRDTRTMPDCTLAKMATLSYSVVSSKTAGLNRSRKEVSGSACIEHDVKEARMQALNSAVSELVKDL